MVTTIAAIRAGLKARLATIADFTHSAESVIPDQVNTPCAIVEPPSTIDYQQTMAGSKTELVFTITVLAAPAQLGAVGGQEAIDLYLNSSDAKSVKKAIQGDGTLGAIADDLIVTKAYDVGVLVFGTTPFVGAK